MDGLVAAQIAGTAAAVLSVGLNVPQAWTSCARREVQGLSAAGRWLLLVQSVAWLVYAVVQDVPVQLAANAVCAVLQAAVLAALLVLAPATRRPGVLGLQAGASAGCLLLVAHCASSAPQLLGPLAAALGGVATLPQLLLLLRRPAAGTGGVSRTATLLALLASLCWGAYGALLLRPEVWLPSLAGAVVALGTLALLRPAPVPARVPAAGLVLVPRPRVAGTSPRPVAVVAA